MVHHSLPQPLGKQGRRKVRQSLEEGNGCGNHTRARSSLQVAGAACTAIDDLLRLVVPCCALPLFGLPNADLGSITGFKGVRQRPWAFSALLCTPPPPPATGPCRAGGAAASEEADSGDDECSKSNETYNLGLHIGGLFAL